MDALYPDLDAFLTEATERFRATRVNPAFLEPGHSMNRMSLAALSIQTSAEFALPPDTHIQSDADEGPAGELKYRIWHELGSRLQGDGRCLIYNHPALVSASGILIVTGLDSDYALRVPQDVLDWAIEAAVRAQGEHARESQAVVQSRLGPDWLIGAYLDHEIAWCRQMFKATY